MTQFKIGQKVFDVRLGGGIIKDIDYTNEYPIIVHFLHKEQKERYTEDGKLYMNDKYPSLYETNPFENTFKERVMEVSQDTKLWLKRVVFYKKNDACYLAWSNTETIDGSKTEQFSTTWKYAREIEPEPEIVELTIEDISAGKGAGVPAHLIRIKK